MNETIAQYSARIASYVKGKDPLEVQHRSHAALASLVEGAPADLLQGDSLQGDSLQKTSPAKWSVREILAHLADVESVNTWRYRQIIEHSGRELAAFDQSEWARLGDYAAADERVSLETFRLLRENNLRMFARLTPEEWQRFGIHAERGRMTLAELVGQIAGHDLNHIEQVGRLVGKVESA